LVIFNAAAPFFGRAVAGEDARRYGQPTAIVYAAADYRGAVTDEGAFNDG